MKKIVLLSVVFASLAFAEVKLSPSYDKCMDKSGGVTSSMLDCGNTEIKIQDTKLNKAYKNAMKALEPKKQTELKDVQRLWVKYRDAQCGFYNGLTGGTIDSLNASSCVLEMTAQRTQELENIVE
jgi:uncharacterized protein YecT (DUF1311 family)